MKFMFLHNQCKDTVNGYWLLEVDTFKIKPETNEYIWTLLESYPRWSSQDSESIFWYPAWMHVNEHMHTDIQTSPILLFECSVAITVEIADKFSSNIIPLLHFCRSTVPQYGYVFVILNVLELLENSVWFKTCWIFCLQALFSFTEQVMWLK
jgi:hypothetical protein